MALANSPHYRGFELSDSIPNVEAAKANAKLIAKAPQLLATLKDVVAHLRSFTLDPGEGEDDAPALTAAEALIAETEGCEP